MSTKRKQLFPTPAHMTQSEAMDFLRRQVFEDAVAAGWLQPCARKEGRGKDTIFYAFLSVNDVSLRIASGEYPRPKAGMMKGKEAA